MLTIVAIGFAGSLGDAPQYMPFAAQPAAAHHWPSSCGGENQKPCTVFQHVPSCKPNLVEEAFKVCRKRDNNRVIGGDPLKLRKDCGRKGEKACKFPVVPSCNEGLVEQIGPGICTLPGNDIISMAANYVHDTGPLIEGIARAMLRCDAIQMLGSSINPRADAAQLSLKARNILGLSCMQDLLDEANAAGFETLTLGVDGSAGLGVGGSIENGFAFDTAMRRPPTVYNTASLVFNTIGAGGSTVIGIYKANNRDFGGDAHGASASFTKIGGSGIAAWFNYDGSVAGTTVSINVGAEGEFAYVRNTTNIIKLLPDALPTRTIAPRPAPRPNPWADPSAGISIPDRRPAPAPVQPTVEGEILNVADAMARGFAEAQEIKKRQTRIKFCNRTSNKNKPINVAVAYVKPARSGREASWHSDGWYNIKRKKCETIWFDGDENDNGYDMTVMIYARYPTGRIIEGEDLRFCINRTNAFGYMNADRRKCGQEGDEWVTGRAVDIEPGGFTFTFND